MRIVTSFHAPSSLTLVVALLPLVSEARELSRDEFFVVASKHLLSGGVTGIGTPSVNDAGDIVVRVTTAAGTEHRVFLFSAQMNNPPQGNTPSITIRSSANTLASLPVINNNKSVVSHHSFTMGNQNILRFDFDSGTSTYSSIPIARGNVTQVQPFSFVSNLAAIDNSTPANVYFYGERTPPSQPLNKRIYRSDHEVTAPQNETPIASYPNVFSTLEQYVAASANSYVVYRGTKSGELGVYTGDANMPVATPSLGFSTTGTRPGINSLSTVAFYGVYTRSLVPQLPGIFLRLQGDASPRVAGNMAARVLADDDLLVPFGLVPSDYDSTARTALNDYNQVAFLGVDSAGNQAIFTTALGRTRKLAAVGDYRVFNGQKSVTGLALYNGLGTKGQVVFLANTSDGDQLILLANRAYNQELTTYSPITPSYHDTQYLLRSVPNSGFPARSKGTIGWVGCNLTSTANILNFFGATTSPMEFQTWLIAHRAKYIDKNNDFRESALEEFSQYLISQGKAAKVVYHRGVHRIAYGSNLAKILSELRSGRAVKLRVPNNSEQYGHFIIAYGLVDPSKHDAAIGRGDILIADPGKANDFTLADYAQLGSPQTYDQAYGSTWLEGDSRVYLYDTVPQGSLAISAYSPIQILLTDSMGRRAGFTSATGVLNEIPGSDYFEETSYYTLDEGGVPGEPVWGSSEPVKRILINGISAGPFTLTIRGTGTGSYAVSILGNGGLSPNTTSVSGNINSGETRTVDFNLQTVKPMFLDSQMLSGANITWTIVGDPSRPISVESSANLINWTTLPSPQITNGVGTITVNTTNGPSKQFLRAVQ